MSGPEHGPCCEEEFARSVAASNAMRPVDLIEAAAVEPGGPVLLVAPPLFIDDPSDVRYSVHRRGRVVMAGTAPSEEEAQRLAFGEGPR